MQLKSDKSNDRVLGVAIFGLGRAGTIHISNIVKNARVKLLYVVEDIESKHQDLKNYWKLGEDVALIHSKDSDKIYKDPRYYIYTEK